MLVCLATLLSLGTRLASLLGYEKFIGEDDFSADFIDEGKALMKRGEYQRNEEQGSKERVMELRIVVVGAGGGRGEWVAVYFI